MNLQSDERLPNMPELEETFPDLLKNTPSNIARLEDVIENCKNHYKYLAQTRSPSDGEDIRWYFCKVPFMGKELAALIPRTETVGKSDYFRFSIRDSLALEASFLQREEELLSYWWKEYAECSEGPKGSFKTSEATSEDESVQPFPEDEERVGVPVKGGLYEVDLAKRHCFPVYWSGEKRRVLRGHWYARKGNLDWLPVREDISEQLEIAYHRKVWLRRSFQPSGLFAARIDIQGSSEGSHALFTGEDDTWDALLVSGRGNAVKLRRGFSLSGSSKPTQDELRQQKEEEMDDYCSQVPVGHLVFMVPGIGQTLEKTNLVDDVGDFRHMAASLAEDHLSPYQRSMQRVLFIPCQWRRGLRLRGESAVEKITLDGVRGLRVTLSATVHDVLYYMSPIYCQDIIDSVSNQLNRLYKKFLKRNPGYKGKVSIYGLSFGSVLSYDILCHQECFRATSSGFVYTGKAEKIGCSPETKIFKDNEVSADRNVCEETSTSQLFSLESSVTSAVTTEVSEEFRQSSVQRFEENLQSSVEDDKKNDSSSDQTVETKEAEEEKLADAKQINQSVSSLEEEKSIETEEVNQHVFSLKEEITSLKAKLEELELKETSTTFNVEDEAKDDKKEISENAHSLAKERIWTSYMPYIKYTKLDFEVDTFFAIGSPLGVFLALRNIRIGIGKGKDYWHDESISEAMPSCKQMLNIFHPYDPVAYRLEPLACKEYQSKRPALIPHHRGGKRLHIGFQVFAEDITVRCQSVMSYLNSLRVKMITFFQSGSKENLKDSLEESKSKEKSYGSVIMERLTRGEGGRVDHVLQEKTFEHPYISALRVHTNYWRDHDTVLFILKHLYRDIPEDPEESLRPQNTEGSLKTGTPAISIFFKNDVMDEDVPLTFSNEAMIKEFTRKARRSMRP